MNIKVLGNRVKVASTMIRTQNLPYTHIQITIGALYDSSAHPVVPPVVDSSKSSSVKKARKPGTQPLSATPEKVERRLLLVRSLLETRLQHPSRARLLAHFLVCYQVY